MNKNRSFHWRVIGLVVISAVIFSFAGYGKEQDRTYYPSGKLKGEILRTDDGARIFKNYYENGQIQEERFFNKGYKEEGLWKYYYEDGTVKSEGLYEGGKLQWSKRYYEGGQLASEQVSKNGKPFIHREFYKSGGLSREENLMVGSFKFYYESGELGGESLHMSGTICGAMAYYKNGELRRLDFMQGPVTILEFFKEGELRAKGWNSLIKKWISLNDKGIADPKEFEQYLNKAKKEFKV